MRRIETLPAPVIGWPVCLALVALMVMPVTAVDQTWPHEAYRVEWEEAHIPEEVAANVTIAVPVTLRNNGDRAWPASQVLVSYHWFRDGKLVVWDGERTPFPRDLRAGSRAAMSVRVATPSRTRIVRADGVARSRERHLVRAQGGDHAHQARRGAPTDGIS